MKKYILTLLVFALFLNSSLCFAQIKTEKFEITSEEVKGVTYSIEVVLPNGYDATKKYPIMYFTDWWFASQLAPGINGLLSFGNIIEPIIMVGIKTKAALVQMIGL